MIHTTFRLYEENHLGDINTSELFLLSNFMYVHYLFLFHKLGKRINLFDWALIMIF